MCLGMIISRPSGPVTVTSRSVNRFAQVSPWSYASCTLFLKSSRIRRSLPFRDSKVSRFDFACTTMARLPKSTRTSISPTFVALDSKRSTFP